MKKTKKSLRKWQNDDDEGLRDGYSHRSGRK